MHVGHSFPVINYKVLNFLFVQIKMQKTIITLLNPNEMLGKPCVSFFLTKVSFQVLALFIPIVFFFFKKY